MLKSKNELTFTPSLLNHFHDLIHAFDYNPVIFSPVVPFFSHSTSSCQAPDLLLYLGQWPTACNWCFLHAGGQFQIDYPTEKYQQLLTEG